MNLNQFFTPTWAAEILFNEHFTHLTEKDLVWEPSCGKGHMLSAIPSHIPAIGSDIDPTVVENAVDTGRPCYVGDFRTVVFPRFEEITAVFGNPPFDLGLFEALMSRCESILSVGNKAGFVLPAYFFQTSKTFMRFARKWDINQEIIPRDLFKTAGLLSKPLIFATLTRDEFPQLFGFRLHKELVDVNSLTAEMKEIITNQVRRSGSVWREAVVQAVKNAGGRATLDQVYQNMTKKPTANPFWKEQVRKVINQSPFERVGDATYQLN